VKVELELSDDQVAALAERVAEVIGSNGNRPERLDTAGAAELLACSRRRIHELVAREELHPRRDGKRLVFERRDVDAYWQRCQ
jgi:excisionase family DNA binding protein